MGFQNVKRVIKHINVLPFPPNYTKIRKYTTKLSPGIISPSYHCLGKLESRRGSQLDTAWARICSHPGTAHSELCVATRRHASQQHTLPLMLRRRQPVLAAEGKQGPRRQAVVHTSGEMSCGSGGGWILRQWSMCIHSDSRRSNSWKFCVIFTQSQLDQEYVDVLSLHAYHGIERGDLGSGTDNFIHCLQPT